MELLYTDEYKIMTDDLTELNGVGPARSDYLAEAGYETFEEIGDADNEQLAEDVDIPEDTALELIVQSQNMAAEQDAEVETEAPKSVTEEVEEAIDEGEGEPDESGDEAIEEAEAEIVQDDPPEAIDEGEDDPDESEDGPDEYNFTITFGSGLAYDTFFDAAMSQRSKMLQSNRSGADAFDHALEQMRNGGMDEPVELEMNEEQLNNLHNSVRQTTISYKGNNLIDHMDALNNVLDQINEVRDEHLF